jgi:hypothetical protein
MIECRIFTPVGLFLTEASQQLMVNVLPPPQKVFSFVAMSRWYPKAIQALLREVFPHAGSEAKSVLLVFVV